MQADCGAQCGPVMMGFRLKIRRYRRWIALSLGLLTLLLVLTLAPVNLLFDQVALSRYLRQSGMIAAPLYVLLFAGATTLGFPGNIMAIAGGAVFGLWWGTLWSVVGGTLGAIGAFWLARYLLHGWAERRFGHHPLLCRLKAAIAYDPFYFVLMVRLTPISPFSLVNFLFGLTPLDLKTYSLGTLVGITPLSAAYCWLGVTGKRALSGGAQGPFFLALGVLALLSLLPLLRRRSR